MLPTKVVQEAAERSHRIICYRQEVSPKVEKTERTDYRTYFWWTNTFAQTVATSKFSTKPQTLFSEAQAKVSPSHELDLHQPPGIL